MKAVPDEPACDCLPHVDGLLGLICACDCHAGPPLSLALLCRTYAQMVGKPHLRVEGSR